MFIKAQEASLGSFKTYGQLVLLPEGPAPLGTETVRFWPALAKYLINGQTEMGLCTCLERPRQIENLERHSVTPEVLIPLDDNFLLPVAAADQPVDEDNKLKVKDIRIMKVKRGTVVIMNPGVWHWAVWPETRREVTYLVLFKLNTPKDDFEKRDTEEVIEF